MTAVGIIVAAIVAVGGWFVVNKLAARRELISKRREYRTTFLIDTWIALEAASNREDNVRLARLEEAIARVQLLGSDRQIDLAQEFSRTMAQHSGASPGELLTDLRNDLRSELELGTVDDQIVHLRISQEAEFDQLRAYVQKALRSSVPPHEPVPEATSTGGQGDKRLTPSVSVDLADLVGLADNDPAAAMREAHGRVTKALQRALGAVGDQVSAASSTVELARRAAERGQITPETLNAVEGITVMRNLWARGPRPRVTTTDALDYLGLVEGVLYTIRQNLGA